MIRGIHHIAINTANFQAMIDFYQQALGFERIGEEFRWQDNALIDAVVGVEGSAARTAMLKAGNLYFEVFEYAAPPPRDGAPLRPHDRGYTHFALDVTDIEAEQQRLIAAGMTFLRTVPDGHGGIRAIYGKDPDGNVVEIQQLSDDHPYALAKLSIGAARAQSAPGEAL
jgi:catechol 2,3-dioxygenase-like lactoylglutathione lyase family enzyme